MDLDVEYVHETASVGEFEGAIRTGFGNNVSPFE